MSDESPQGTPASATATAALVAQPAPTAPLEDPSWLKDRLERATAAAEKAVLAKLGISDTEKAKAALEAAKIAEEANKSAEQKAAEYAAQLTSERARSEKLMAVATEHSARMMAGLSAEQQAAVRAIAGDDPATQLRTIGALTPTWAKSAAEVQAAVEAATPPATTAPPPNAPAPTSAGSPPDHRAVYAQMKSTNPFESAAYALSNPSVYDTKS